MRESRALFMATLIPTSLSRVSEWYGRIGKGGDTVELKILRGRKLAGGSAQNTTAM